jgi:aminopeptidase YwaD
MSKRQGILFACLVVFSAVGLAAQYTPWFYWTLLPKGEMDEIVGEASGETAWNTIAEINAFNRERFDEEYSGNFFETQVIVRKLKQYGLSGVEVVTFPGGEAWRGLRGELWEIEPNKTKWASFLDMMPMLASGSADTDAVGELVWVGRGTPREIAEARVEGKIIVTEGNLSSAYNAAVQQGALGAVAISQSRPYFDPLQMPWAGISARRRSAPGQEGIQPPPARFAFQLPVREGDILKRRLLANEKIKVRALVRSKTELLDLENVIAVIPGTDPDAGEVILSAHLFEGFYKQGANDNISGSAGILEAARVLHTLIGEGRIPKPKRTIRFIWGPEFSGIGRWVQANQPIMEKTLCNINMDMVGEWLSKNQAFFCLMRTSFGNPHYINDVMENYYRYVGEGNRERIQNRSTAARVPVRIVAPFGADEPFPYSIETHYGASDHEVFNDWGVGVPGIMMIAWPDKWYHTSGDLADKSDPTQMKRAAVIGAAGAYTVARADAELAVKIAGETTGNATRRLGHRLAVGIENLNGGGVETLARAHKSARYDLEAALINERDTLDSILELAQGDKTLQSYIGQMKRAVDGVGAAGLAALDAHLAAVARKLGTKPAPIALEEIEKKAMKVVPRPTAKVRENGYREYQKFITAVPAEVRAKYPTRGDNLFLASTAELQLLVNGRHSVLDIKKLLDAQYERKSSLQAVFNYLEILKTAGLVEW